MTKPARSAQHLEGLLAARLDFPQITISVVPRGDAGDWSIDVRGWGNASSAYTERVQEIAKQLRTQYDLKKEID